MDTIDLLLKRRSVVAANITGPGPDAAALETILRAATRVPDHGKLAPWRIQVLQKEGQQRLGDLFADLFAKEIPEANEKQIEFERQRPQRAPVLLVVTSKIVKPHKIPELEQLLSGGAVCTNMLIAANALGFCAQWLTEWPAYRPEITRALGHDPECDQIIGFVYIGTPVEPPTERPRPELDAVVSEWTGEAVAAE